MTTTTISLADLSGATADYLRSEVEVRITDVTRNLGRGDDGTFTVRLVNADRPRGIRLTDVTVHLQVDSPAVILLSARGTHGHGGPGHRRSGRPAAAQRRPGG